MPEDWQDQRLRFMVSCPASMTLGTYVDLATYLRDLCVVEGNGHDFIAEIKIADVAAQVGDLSPDEWALHAVDLPVDGHDVPDGMGRLVVALALEEWWGETLAEIRRLGADVTRPPHLVEVATHA